MAVYPGCTLVARCTRPRTAIGLHARGSPASPGSGPWTGLGWAVFRHILVAIVLALAVPQLSAAETLRVLFVGNSLTYYNDLPFMVAALSQAGEVQIKAGMVAIPNAALEDHWADGGARAEIASGRWDVVVMQQGPSSLASSRANLVEWAGKFAAEARSANLRPALLTVWPPDSRRGYFDEVIESYQVAARECGCELLPAGPAWREAWKRSRGLSLYGPDGFHPSTEGSYLVALVVWGGLTGADVSAAPARLQIAGGKTVEISEKRANIYRGAAAAALALSD